MFFKRDSVKHSDIDELLGISSTNDDTLDGVDTTALHSDELEPAEEREIYAPPPEPEKKTEQLTTLDRLGQTLVATICVAELSGRDAAELVHDLLGHVESAGVRHFVFDLQNVVYMDSSCIGAMVEMLTRLQEAGGRIALVNASQSVAYLFRLTKLDRLFPICRDVMTAIAAVERPNESGKKKRRG